MYTFEDIKKVDMEVAEAITAEFDRQSSHDCFRELGKPGGHVGNGQRAHQ